MAENDFQEETNEYSEYRQSTLVDLQCHGVNYDSVWMEWLHFSSIQAAGCLGVDKETVRRFVTWRKLRDPAEAWS